MIIKPGRIKEVKTLINAGYPILNGIGLLVIAIGGLIKLLVVCIFGSGLRPNGVVMVICIVIFTSLLGALLIKIGIEAKKEEN